MIGISTRIIIKYMSEFSFTYHAHTKDATFTRSGSKYIYTWNVAWPAICGNMFSVNDPTPGRYVVTHRYESSPMGIFVNELTPTNPIGFIWEGENSGNRDASAPVEISCNLCVGNFSTSGSSNVIGMARCTDLVMGNTPVMADSGIPNPPGPTAQGAWTFMVGKYRSDPCRFRCENLMLHSSLVVTVDAGYSTGISFYGDDLDIIPGNPMDSVLDYGGIHQFEFTKEPAKVAFSHSYPSASPNIPKGLF